MQQAIASLFRALDSVTIGVWRSLKAKLANREGGPIESMLFAAIIGGTGLRVLLGGFFSRLDAAWAIFEKLAVSVAMLGMTALAFNEYLQRELQPRFGDLGGIWSLEGQMNVALLLMVLVGFVGASLATRSGKHITIDAAERVLSPSAARTVRRFTSVVAALLCFAFAQGSWHAVFSHGQDNFEGAKVWAPMVLPVNFATSLIPGDKFGPRSCFADAGDEAAIALKPSWCPPVNYPSLSKWEDAQFDKGLDFADFPPVFSYVQSGDRFPLWIAMMVLVVAFAVMGMRFLGLALVPGEPDPAQGPRSAPSRRPADVILAGGLPGAVIALGLGAWLGTGWVIVLASLALVFLGAPLFVAVGTGTLAAWALLRDGGAETVVADMFESTKKQELLSIPFFVLAGNLMTQGSIARRLIGFARTLIGDVPGGLGAAAVVACAIFAAISGSSPVTVIAIGTILYPMLEAENYERRYAMGVLTTAGGLGIIIPPSIPMIVYAIIVGGLPDVGAIDPASLFKAGILPGAFIALMLILYTFYVTWPRTPEEAAAFAASRPPVEGTYFGRVARSFVHSIPALMLPVLILGGIYGWLDLGIFGIPIALQLTVTEAAAVAVVYALFVELVIHRELKWRKLPDVFSESAIMMGSLFLILVIAISLNRFLVFEQIPEAATEWVLGFVAKDNVFGFLILVNLFLLALGCVMDILSAILIVAPLLAPIAAQYGIDPIHFGIMFIVNLELGYLTPPMGINLFVASSVFERPILEVIRAVLPFLVLMLFCLAVIIFFPSLSLFLLR